MKAGNSVHGTFVYITEKDDNDVFELIERQTYTKSAALSACIMDTFVEMGVFDSDEEFSTPILCFEPVKKVAAIIMGDITPKEIDHAVMNKLLMEIIDRAESDKEIKDIPQEEYMKIFDKNQEAMGDVLRARQKTSPEIQENRSLKIWKLKGARDLFKYKSIANRFILYNKEYYLETASDIALDDFLEKGDPEAVKGMTLTI